MFRSEGCPSG